MPLVDDDPVNPPAPLAQSNTIEVANTDFHSVVVDTRYTPVSNLLTSVQGASWIVNYFSQILTSQSQVSGQQQNLDSPYQQYTLIKDFELRVTTPLATTQDTATATMKMTGAANVYPFLIPNVGDMFIADVGDGREAVFKLTEVERKSVFKDTIYTIQYELMSIEDEARTDDLYSKVQQTLQFVRDFLMHGQNPLLQTADFDRVRLLADRYHELAELYFSRFVSTEYKTVVLPLQSQPTYDPFLTKALPKFFSTWDAMQVREMRVLNMDDDVAIGSATLWDALLQRNPRTLKRAVTQTGLTSTQLFAADPMCEGIVWTGLRAVVYPLDPPASVNLDPLQVKLIDGTLQLQETTASEPTLTDPSATVAALAQLVGDPTLTVLPYGQTPLLKPVLSDAYYVLSQQFYDRTTTGQSKLELAVWDYLNGNAVDWGVLQALCDTFDLWGTLEQFYYLPILLVLIKANIRFL